MSIVERRLLDALHDEIQRQGGDMKSYEAYRSKLGAAMQRLYHGGRDANFIGTWVRNIDKYLGEAWNKGALEVGVEPSEMTNDDRAILNSIINNESDFIMRIAGEISQAHDDGMEQAQFDKQYGARLDLWANRYNETVNRARMQFGAKVRLKWELGPTEEHCSTCPKLNGIIAFGHEWESARVHPQMPPNEQLECGGWRCLCKLTPTTERRTARALDKIMTIVLMGGMA